jgi:hypothetical protein
MMRCKKLLMAIAGALALLLPATVLLAASLHAPHVDTIGEFSAGVGGECTWHFVHNQIPFQKNQDKPPNLLTATFAKPDAVGGEEVLDDVPFKRNKKVDHFDIVTISSEPVSLLNASSEIPEGKLVLSDVSCVELQPDELLSCQCWNDLTADELFTSAVEAFDSATSCQILILSTNPPDEGINISTVVPDPFILEARPDIEPPGCLFFVNGENRNIVLTKTMAQTCFSELTTLAAQLDASPDPFTCLGPN